MLPYRNLSLKVLGAISPLKTQTVEETKDEDEPEESPNEDTNDFTTQRKKIRKNYIPKDQIFQNITTILDRFELERTHSRR